MSTPSPNRDVPIGSTTESQVLNARRADTPYLPIVETTNESESTVECSSAGERELYEEFEHIVGFGYPDSEKDKPTYSPKEIVMLPGIAYISHSFYQKHKKFYFKLAQLHLVSDRLGQIDPDSIPALIEWKANYYDCDNSIQKINADIALLHNRTPIPQLPVANQIVESGGSSSSSSSRRTFVIRRHIESSSSSSSRRTFVIRRHNGSDEVISMENANEPNLELSPMQDHMQDRMQDRMQVHLLDQQQDAVNDATLDSALFYPSEKDVFKLGITKFLESNSGFGASEELPPITPNDVEAAHRFWKSRCDVLFSKHHPDQKDTNVLAFYRLIQSRVEDPFIRGAMDLIARVDPTSSSVDSSEVEFYKTVVCKDPSYLL